MLIGLEKHDKFNVKIYERAYLNFFYVESFLAGFYQKQPKP